MTVRRRIPLTDLIAKGPVQSGRQRHAFMKAMGLSGVRYQGQARVPFPVLPLQAFGVAYDLDLVLVDESAEWDMHEYARVATPDGPVWLCKDSRVGTLEQSIVADLDGLDHVLPEVPLPRRRSKVDVVDKSRGDTLDLSFAYTNVDGVPVEASFKGPAPVHTLRHRNSSTMGHSANAVLCALDVSASTFATSSSVTLGGVRQQMRKILGFVPFQVALRQTQAGLSTGSWLQGRDADGLWTRHASGALQRWTKVRSGGEVVLSQVHPWRTLRYSFQVNGDALELFRIDIDQHGRTDEPCSILFAPAIPDLRFAFDQAWKGRWVIDVNGQHGHADGGIRLERGAGFDRLHIVPHAPRWTLDRPLVSEVRFDGDDVSVDVRRK